MLLFQTLLYIAWFQRCSHVFSSTFPNNYEPPLNSSYLICRPIGRKPILRRRVPIDFSVFGHMHAWRLRACPLCANFQGLLGIKCDHSRLCRPWLGLISTQGFDKLVLEGPWSCSLTPFLMIDFVNIASAFMAHDRTRSIASEAIGWLKSMLGRLHRRSCLL